MVIVRKPMILLADVVGAVLVAALLGVGALNVIAPGWEAHHSLPQLRDELNLQHKELTALQARNAATRDALVTAERSMAENSARPLADAGKLLELIAAECDRNGVVVRRIDPLPDDAAPPARSRRATVTAAGALPDLYRVLRAMEAWSQYVRISALEIHGPSAAGSDGLCEARWIVTVSYLADGPTGGAGAP